MKNKTVICILFFFIGLVNHSIISLELTEEQFWAIALTGIMTENNNDSHYTLNSNINRNKNVYLELLRRDWGINNRQELLEMLVQMENNGHAIQLENIKSIIVENGNDLNIILKNHKFISTNEYNRLLFTYSNWDLYKNLSIKSWDLGRNIALCRWGYDIGFITEEEAWQKIMYYAKEIQPLYASWNKYGYSYFLGRIFWASGFGLNESGTMEEYISKTDRIYKKLINESGIWFKLQWDIKFAD